MELSIRVQRIVALIDVLCRYYSLYFIRNINGPLPPNFCNQVIAEVLLSKD
jgi:hypothetical protein